MVKNCACCGVEFKITPYQNKVRPGMFCSIQCRNKTIKKGSGHKWKHDSSNCLECGNSFAAKYKTSKFCSAECYQEHRRKTDNIGPARNRVNRFCLACGKPFETFSAWIRKGGGKYCSRECADKSKAVTMGGENSKLFGQVPPKRKRGYRGDLDMFFRSSWEANYARLLNWNRINWDYEPKAFRLEIDGKPTTYRPDFYNKDLGIWIEVKGYMSKLAKAKIEEFANRYPDEKLILLEGDYYKHLCECYAKVIPNWEI